MGSAESSPQKTGLLEWSFSSSEMKDTMMTSELFSITEIPNSKFSIRALYEIFEEKLTIDVCKTNSEKVKADISVIITAQDGSVIGERTEKCETWQETCPFIFQLLMRIGRTYKVTCKICIFGPLNIANTPKISSDSYDYVKPFLLNTTLSDFTIVIGEEELPVHKFVLGAQSSVLLSIFESNLEEVKTNRVVIDDIPVEVMKNVLSFLYTRSDEALKNTPMALHMLIVAEEYDIIKLKDLCECALVKQILISNVLNLFEQAEILNAKKLRNACFKFIIDNRQSIIDLPHFKTLCFEKPQIMYELMNEIFKKK